MEFKFYDGTNMMKVNLLQIINGEYEANDLQSDICLRSIGECEKHTNNLIYEGDILYLDTKEMSKDSAFWDSNCGMVMKEKGFDEVWILIKPTKKNETNYVLAFKKNGFNGYNSV